MIKLSTLASKSAIILVCGVALSCSAIGQNITSSPTKNIPTKTSPFLISADEIIYDRDSDIVLAKGNVQIEYNGNKIVAQKITYNQKTARVIAEGNVEIVQKDGNKIYSNQIDMTKDLSAGFVNFLHIETTNNTRFSAANAERRNNQITIFKNATYTACEPFYAKPNSEVLWQVKAKSIVWNSTIKTIQFEDGHFEIFGVPVLPFPTFEIPDPTVNRASGLIAPNFLYVDYLGMGMKNSYFWNLSPHYDFTFSATIYMQQGILAEGEWRQHLKTGNYKIRLAHIYQTNPHLFENNTVDSQETHRFMIATKGDFYINPWWTYGWDIFAQSDQNFSRSYQLEDYSEPTQVSQFYLNGLKGKNYFDIRFYNFKIQDMISENALNEQSAQQAWALPLIDYFFTPNKSVYDGEISFHSNLQSIYRDSTNLSYTDWQDYPLNNAQLFSIAGTSLRWTGELEWKKRFYTYNGLILTPILALRADAILTNAHEDNIASITDSSAINFNIVSSTIRSMFTAGLELRYPFFITAGSSTHILEPTAQFFIRNNEQYAGRLPNEDAQSFIFDATTLFQRDKFSGYDRVEGGTRANIGLRYSGSLNNNWSLYGLFGQSFHLAGKNSFAEKDFINISTSSGLETTRSDYVAMFGASNNSGFFITSRGRFDKETGKIHRSELEASQKWSKLWTSTQYAYIQGKTNHENTQDRQEISFKTGLKLSNYWSINNNASYDLASNIFVKQEISLNYVDECSSITFSYQQIANPRENTPLHSFNFYLSLRTLTNIGKK